MIPTPPRTDSELLVSYLTLRKALGWIAIAMPIVVRLVALALDHVPAMDSISAYYYTSGRDEFVGALCAIGVFLIFYRGYDVLDNVLTNVAGLAAVGIGLLPLAPEYDAGIRERCHGPLGFHIVAVTVFFGIISYLVFFQFTKSTAMVMTAQKRQRNTIYRASGIVMAAAYVVIAILKWRRPDASIFWPETSAIIAFAAAWLTKGETILKDR